MKVQIDTDRDVVIFRLKGAPDPESVDSFFQHYSHLLSKKKIIFNLADLDFVGSSGIFDLMESVKNLKKNAELKFCNAGIEFQTILSSTHFEGIEIYENEDLAQKSFIE